jgi:hypothetical protein
MKKLLTLLKIQLNNPLFMFISLGVLGAICFALSPATHNVDAPIGVIGYIGYIFWGLIPIMFFGGGKYLNRKINKKK